MHNGTMTSPSLPPTNINVPIIKLPSSSILVSSAAFVSLISDSSTRMFVDVQASADVWQVDKHGTSPLRYLLTSSFRLVGLLFHGRLAGCVPYAPPVHNFRKFLLKKFHRTDALLTSYSWQSTEDRIALIKGIFSSSTADT